MDVIRSAFDRVSDRLLWLYWKSNKRFLAAFVDALLGDETGDLRPNGEQAVARAEQYVKEMPRPVFRQVMAAIWLLPVAVPPSMPYSELKRIFVKTRAVLTTRAARAKFLASSRKARVEHVDQVHRRLIAQAAEEEDDLIKAIVMLNQVKGLLLGSYMELEAMWKQIGYTPFPKRDFDPPTGPDLVDPPRTKASTLLAEKVKRPRDVARMGRNGTTYCVIGSGAGGTMAARAIQREDPRGRVVMLEAGPFVPNDKLPVHLLDTIMRYYMNGGTTLSKDEKTAFRQARAVGGGTLVNNSVAFKPEGFWWDRNIVERWKSMGVELDWTSLYEEFDPISYLINVGPLDDRVITPMARTVRDGFAKANPELTVKKVSCNLVGCIGCGRCNVGCKYGAKQSMAETELAKFVEDGGVLVPDASVLAFELTGPRGDQRIRSAVLEDDDGGFRIEADRFVLAAGAYASTKVLWRSGFTGALPGVRTVGKRFSGNVGTGVMGVFDEPQLGWNGQQVGYVVEVPEERMVIETGFAPPPVLGTVACHWGKPLLRLLHSYGNLAVGVPVLGTLAYGRIERGPYPSGYVIDFQMIEEDWRRLAVGMKLTAKALLAMGAKEVFTTRFDARSMRPDESVDEYFGGIGSLQYLRMETAHLQGGNVTHPDPSQGVVDETLKAHGIENLWIADASVIPAPITLNIQLMVMALGAYAGRRAAA